MKNNIFLLGLVCFFSLFVYSCSDVENEEISYFSPITKTFEHDSIESITECITPYVDTDTIVAMPYFYDASGANFFKMKGFKFTIKNRACNKYLSTRGRDNEVELSDVANSEKEYFTIEHTGTYKIYSCADGTPLTLGIEIERIAGKRKERRILMLPKTDDPSYASRWYLYAANTSGYFYIQRYQMEEIPGGELGYYSFQVDECSKNGFGVYSGLASQEYQITPLDTFKLKNIKYAPREAYIQHLGTISQTVGYTNEKNVEMAYDFELYKDVTEESSFEERQNINFILGNANSMRFQRPGVTNKNVDIIPSQDAPYDAIYQPTTQKINKKLKAVFPVNIPARSKVNVTYTWNYYKISAGYEVQIDCNGVECVLSGVWHGTVYVNDIPDSEQKWEIINLDSGSVRKINMSELLKL